MEKPLVEGFLGLHKRGGTEVRYFVLREDRLEYFKTPDDFANGQKPRGRLAIEDVVKVEADDDSFELTLEGHGPLKLSATDNGTVTPWVEALEKLMREEDTEDFNEGEEEEEVWDGVVEDEEVPAEADEGAGAQVSQHDKISEHEKLGRGQATAAEARRHASDSSIHTQPGPQPPGAPPPPQPRAAAPPPAPPPAEDPEAAGHSAARPSKAVRSVSSRSLGGDSAAVAPVYPHATDALLRDVFRVQKGGRGNAASERVFELHRDRLRYFRGNFSTVGPDTEVGGEVFLSDIAELEVLPNDGGFQIGLSNGVELSLYGPMVGMLQEWENTFSRTLEDGMDEEEAAQAAANRQRHPVHQGTLYMSWQGRQEEHYVAVFQGHMEHYQSKREFITGRGPKGSISAPDVREVRLNDQGISLGFERGNVDLQGRPGENMEAWVAALKVMLAMAPPPGDPRGGGPDAPAAPKPPVRGTVADEVRRAMMEGGARRSVLGQDGLRKITLHAAQDALKKATSQDEAATASTSAGESPASSLTEDPTSETPQRQGRLGFSVDGHTVMKWAILYKDRLDCWEKPADISNQRRPPFRVFARDLLAVEPLGLGLALVCRVPSISGAPTRRLAVYVPGDPTILHSWHTGFAGILRTEKTERTYEVAYLKDFRTDVPAALPKGTPTNFVPRVAGLKKVLKGPKKEHPPDSLRSPRRKHGHEKAAKDAVEETEAMLPRQSLHLGVHVVPDSHKLFKGKNIRINTHGLGLRAHEAIARFPAPDSEEGAVKAPEKEHRSHSSPASSRKHYLTTSLCLQPLPSHLRSPRAGYPEPPKPIDFIEDKVNLHVTAAPVMRPRRDSVDPHLAGKITGRERPCQPPERGSPGLCPWQKIGRSQDRGAVRSASCGAAEWQKIGYVDGANSRGIYERPERAARS